MKTVIRTLISKIPFVRFWVARMIFLGPQHNTHRFWGVFSTLAEAKGYIPVELNKGFDAPNLSDNFDPAPPERDNTQVAILAKVIPGVKTLFDFGGNVGMCFYQYRTKMAYPADFRWIVSDVPFVCEAGRRIAVERGETQLIFSDDPAAADGVDVYLTNGALQYLDDSLAEMLSKLKTKPRHVFVNRVPLTDKETFYTLQHMGYSVVPYHLLNRAKFVSAMETLGYEVVERWENDRFCEIILRPEYYVPHYYGFYFRMKA